MSAPRAEQQHLDLPVSGMTCAGCAKTIEKGLGSAPGVALTVRGTATTLTLGSLRPRSATSSMVNGHLSISTDREALRKCKFGTA